MSENIEWVITIIASGHCNGAKFTFPLQKKKKKSLWYENYFMPKTVKAQTTQEETLTFPFNGLKEFKMEDPVLE